LIEGSRLNYSGNLVKEERGDLLADPQNFGQGGKITSVSY
jgi:hypothetical protein